MMPIIKHLSVVCVIAFNGITEWISYQSHFRTVLITEFQPQKCHKVVRVSLSECGQVSSHESDDVGRVPSHESDSKEADDEEESDD